jgi:hypothetical protein
MMWLQRQFEKAKEFLEIEMGGHINKTSRERAQINLTKEDMTKYIHRFQQLDKHKKGFITVNDLRNYLKVRPQPRSFSFNAEFFFSYFFFLFSLLSFGRGECGQTVVKSVSVRFHKSRLRTKLLTMLLFYSRFE